jgi:hypothetical protein
MVNFPSNYPVSGSQGPSSGDYDTNPTLIQDIDAAWRAITLFQTYNPPNDVITQMVMNSINTLCAFFKQYPPPQGSNAAAVQTDLNTTFVGAYNGCTLAELCQNYTSSDTTTVQDSVNCLEGNTDVFSAVMNDFGDYGSVYVNRDSSSTTNAAIQTDISTLISALGEYGSYMSGSNVTQTGMDNLLKALAKDVHQLLTDLQSSSNNPPISDGYLQNVLSYLNAPIIAGTSDTLASLCTTIATGSPTQVDFDNLNADLGKLGEHAKGGGDFTSFLNDAYYWEYQH